MEEANGSLQLGKDRHRQRVHHLAQTSSVARTPKWSLWVHEWPSVDQKNDMQTIVSIYEKSSGGNLISTELILSYMVGSETAITLRASAFLPAVLPHSHPWLIQSTRGAEI